MNRSLLVFCSFCLLLSACHHVSDDIEPKINYAVQDRYLKSLPAPFPPLTEHEKQQDWGREYVIGKGFAHQLDLYQAITAFKRSEFLVPQESYKRRLEVQYEILLCYFLAKKYSDVVYTFERSDLRNADQTFPVYHDLLVILYESYQETQEEQKAERILKILEESDAESAEKLSLSSALMRADLPTLHQHAENHSDESYLKPFLASYEAERKSVSKAQALNAVLPGAGYLYLGQKKSALTAVLLNGLFIAASVHFFQHKHLAAGLIFTSFEAGWYFGGIYGGGEEAKYYNERLYEQKASPMMNQKGLFPVFMLRYGF
ncbi:MAG: tetratricopeptide repeat protein [Chlamydiales bacterium]|nr:tetratricopeptide repeat protein [Chlamydiales bacterium]